MEKKIMEMDLSSNVIDREKVANVGSDVDETISSNVTKRENQEADICIENNEKKEDDGMNNSMDEVIDLDMTDSIRNAVYNVRDNYNANVEKTNKAKVAEINRKLDNLRDGYSVEDKITLAKFGLDDDLDVLVHHYDPKVRREVAKHDRKKDYGILLADKDPVVRVIIARQTKSPSAIKRLVRDECDHVRACLASNLTFMDKHFRNGSSKKEVTDMFIRILMNDRCEMVRRNIVINSENPKHLKYMLNDTSRFVRTEAARKLADNYGIIKPLLTSSYRDVRNIAHSTCIHLRNKKKEEERRLINEIYERY